MTGDIINMQPELDEEARRILAEYERRAREMPADFYSLHRPANLFIRHGVERALSAALIREGFTALGELKIVEVGCGWGQWLATFEEFDARRENLAGMDIVQERADFCARRFAGADIRSGDASDLPWADRSFDIVAQFGVFTSILDPRMQEAIAGEMLRVLKPGGCIIWYDFRVNNPRNRQVRGVGRRRVEELFAGCHVKLRRITLAPPLTRRIVPISRTLADWLERLRFLNSHLLGTIRPLS